MLRTLCGSKLFGGEQTLAGLGRVSHCLRQQSRTDGSDRCRIMSGVSYISRPQPREQSRSCSETQTATPLQQSFDRHRTLHCAKQPDHCHNNFSEYQAVRYSCYTIGMSDLMQTPGSNHTYNYSPCVATKSNTDTTADARAFGPISAPRGVSSRASAAPGVTRSRRRP